MSNNNIYEVSRITGLSFRKARARYQMFLDGLLDLKQLMERVEVENKCCFEVNHIARIAGIDKSTANRRFKRFLSGEIDEHAVYFSKREFRQYCLLGGINAGI